jgi:phage-related protein
LIKSSVAFSYAGKRSVDFGIYNITIQSGLYEEPFLASRDIREVETRWSMKPYFQNISLKPLVFDLSFAILDYWDDKKIREIARWLAQDNYQPLFFEEDIDRIFYCVPIDDINIIHNGLKQGYITLTFRCDAPWSYTRQYVTPEYDFSDNPNGVLLSFANEGDLYLYPEMWITKVGNGDVSIINQTNGGVEFKFTGLVDGEIVYVDNENQYIATSLTDTYRYDNFNNNYLELVVGVNNLWVTGNCKLQFRYRFKRLQ